MTKSNPAPRERDQSVLDTPNSSLPLSEAPNGLAPTGRGRHRRRDADHRRVVVAVATKAPAREVLIVLDCCHAGDAGSPAILEKTSFGDSLTLLREELTVIAACGPTQQAVEVNGRSEFTAALVDALLGGAADALGQVTAPAMYAYARRRFGPTTQRPVYKSHAKDRLSNPAGKAFLPIHPTAMSRVHPGEDQHHVRRADLIPKVLLKHVVRVKRVVPWDAAVIALEVARSSKEVADPVVVVAVVPVMADEDGVCPECGHCPPMSSAVRSE